MAYRNDSHDQGVRIAQAEEQISLCELLDRVLNKGVVLTGEIVISVADIELLYVGVNLLISSVGTLLESMDEHNIERRQIHETS